MYSAISQGRNEPSKLASNVLDCSRLDSSRRWGHPKRWQSATTQMFTWGPVSRLGACRMSHYITRWRHRVKQCSTHTLNKMWRERKHQRGKFLDANIGIQNMSGYEWIRIYFQNNQNICILQNCMYICLIIYIYICINISMYAICKKNMCIRLYFNLYVVTCYMYI